MRIDPSTPNVLQRLPAPSAPTPQGPAAPSRPDAPASPFMDRLADAVREVNTLQQTANLESEKLATGQSENIQDVVIALERADLALQLTVQVTQKAVDAYREVSRMQL